MVNSKNGAVFLIVLTFQESRPVVGTFAGQQPSGIHQIQPHGKAIPLGAWEHAGQP